MCSKSLINGNNSYNRNRHSSKRDNNNSHNRANTTTRQLRKKFSGDGGGGGGSPAPQQLLHSGSHSCGVLQSTILFLCCLISVTSSSPLQRFSNFVSIIKVKVKVKVKCNLEREGQVQCDQGLQRIHHSLHLPLT